MNTAIASILPAFVHIPAHTFLMGTPVAELSNLARQYGGTRESYREESPQHAVQVAAFAIGQTPITVAAFAPFVTNGGTPPHQWDQQSTQPQHPVVNITWPMANAYTAWLSTVLGLPMRLPFESEWEAAARGQDGRQFPWGDTWRADAAAVKESGLPLPAVGNFPHAASPWGCLDMAGGVWEWTATLDALYPYDAHDGRNDPHQAGRRIIRGGCYVNPHGYARTACRFRMQPDMTNPFLGFRIAYSLEA